MKQEQGEGGDRRSVQRSKCCRDVIDAEITKKAAEYKKKGWTVAKAQQLDPEVRTAASRNAL